jgi:hypothetical protein
MGKNRTFPAVIGCHQKVDIPVPSPASNHKLSPQFQNRDFDWVAETGSEKTAFFGSQASPSSNDLAIDTEK